MEIGIADIRKKEDGNIEITLCSYPSCEEFIKLTLDVDTVWEIAKYCQNNLSYGSQLRKFKEHL